MNSGFLHIDNIPLNDVERYREIIGICLEKGVFNLKNGKVTLMFDNQGSLAEVEVYQKRFKRDKESLQSFEKLVNIKTNT